MQLLVGGFQLLERGLVLLDGRLQPLARVAQLALELFDRHVSGAAASRRLSSRGCSGAEIVKHHEEQRLAVARAERLHGQGDRLLAAIDLDRECARARPAGRVSTRVAQRARNPGRRPRRAMATSVGASARPAPLRDTCRSGTSSARTSPSRFDDDICRRVALQHLRARRAAQCRTTPSRRCAGVARRAPAGDAAGARSATGSARRTPSLPLEDAVLLVDRREQVGVLADLSDVPRNR